MTAKIDIVSQLDESLSKRIELTCDFCEKKLREVKHLIRGADGFICDQCVGLCVEIIAARAERKGKPK